MEARLFEAVCRGDAEELQALLREEGARTDYRYEVEATEGATLLHVLASGGHEDCVRALLDAGADLEAKDATGASPLHSAVFRNRVGCARTLLEAGADKEAKDADGLAPLDISASNGYADCTRVLLEAGAEPDTTDTARGTPLIRAASSPRDRASLLQCVTLLIGAGADTTARGHVRCHHWPAGHHHTPEGRTALDMLGLGVTNRASVLAEAADVAAARELALGASDDDCLRPLLPRLEAALSAALSADMSAAVSTAAAGRSGCPCARPRALARPETQHSLRLACRPTGQQAAPGGWAPASVSALATARLLREVACAAQATAAVGAVKALRAAVSAESRPTDVYAAAVCVGRWADVTAAHKQAVRAEGAATAAVAAERARARAVRTEVAAAAATASGGSEAVALERLRRVDLH